MSELSINKKNFFDITNKIILNSKLSHAYLIEVGNYEQDFKYVLDFIKMILCNSSFDEISTVNSNICNLVDSNNYPDLRIIEPDGQWIKKIQLLNLQEDFKNKSLLNNKRIYIIKECDKLNMASANTMLKFLEEPEENVIAILLTTNRYHVIETILSRCQILSLQDDLVLNDISEDTLELLNLVLKKEELFIRYNYIINSIILDKHMAKEKFFEIQYLIINYLSNNDYDEFYSNNLIKLIKNYNNDELVNYVSIIEEELLNLEYNVNYKLWLDCLFSRLIGGVQYDGCSSC